MNSYSTNLTRTLTDDELLAGAKNLAACERGTIAELIAHLAEIETRSLHLAGGHGSMFVYCRDVLLLPENETYNRIEVARAAQRFPIVFDLLAQGSVCLTTVRLLAPHLTPANHAAVLESARGLRRPQVEELVARLAPKPDVATSIRKLPAPKVAPISVAAPAEGLFGAADASMAPAASADAIRQAAVPSAAARPAALQPAAPLNTRAVVRPLSPDRYKLQLTISGDTLEKLRLAKDMLRHALPSGDDGAILERALTALLVDLAKKKFAATDRPRPRTSKPADPDSRHITAEVKRTVYVRDLGRCAYVSDTGRRCNERAFLEFHHVHPYSEGGQAAVENIELRCRSHNGYEWQRHSGDRFRCEMQDYESQQASAAVRLVKASKACEPARFRTSPRAAPRSGTSAPRPVAR